jgi:hypothetical protein
MCRVDGKNIDFIAVFVKNGPICKVVAVVVLDGF